MDDGFIDDGDSGDERSFHRQIDSLETNNTTERDHEDEADEKRLDFYVERACFATIISIVQIDLVNQLFPVKISSLIPSTSLTSVKKITNML